MKNHNIITKKTLVLSIVAWSIFMLVYWLSFYELYMLCKVGRFRHNVTILEGCILFFLIWFIVFIINAIKKPKTMSKEDEEGYEFYSSSKIKWNFAVAIIIAVITVFYGVKIYHSGINYNGKLAWVLQDLKNKRTVEFQHDNIYKDGIDGIFTDINNKVTLPKTLYVASDFSLEFDSNGKITAFDTYLYGKNDKGKLESYLISYDSDKSEKIKINLNGYVKPDYSKDKLLSPLIKTMKVIPLKKTIGRWTTEKQYGILYYGKRSLGYNTAGIVYINSKGKINTNVDASSEIIGYIVSVYVPGKESQYTPVRYNLTEDLGNVKASGYLEGNNSKDIFQEANNSTDNFRLSKKVRYRLEVTAAAAGSRSYSLDSTNDGGTTWKTINEDPFVGAVGTAAGITFLNDKLGFLCLSHNGGGNGELYRTEDGGKTYTKVDFPQVKVTLNGGKTYNPFDLPGMPYKISGELNVLVGQGSDGDYNGNSKALYKSNDQGKTWQYVKEVANKNIN